MSSSNRSPSECKKTAIGRLFLSGEEASQGVINGETVLNGMTWLKQETCWFIRKQGLAQELAQELAFLVFVQMCCENLKSLPSI